MTIRFGTVPLTEDDWDTIGRIGRKRTNTSKGYHSRGERSRGSQNYIIYVKGTAGEYAVVKYHRDHGDDVKHRLDDFFAVEGSGDVCINGVWYEIKTQYHESEYFNYNLADFEKEYSRASTGVIIPVLTGYMYPDADICRPVPLQHIAEWRCVEGKNGSKMKQITMQDFKCRYWRE